MIFSLIEQKPILYSFALKKPPQFNCTKKRFVFSWGAKANSFPRTTKIPCKKPSDRFAKPTLFAVKPIVGLLIFVVEFFKKTHNTAVPFPRPAGVRTRAFVRAMCVF